jgi:phage terminase large subunit-like protein
MKPPTNLAGYDPVATKGDCSFDSGAATNAVEFFPDMLHHIKGKLAGQPYELNPWERDVVLTLFGWKRPDGTRRYREAFIAVPRKNNKTTLCAGLALYLLFCDGEEGAEVYCAACDREQATMVFDPAAQMVLKQRHLMKRAKVLHAVKRIVVPQTGSFMRAIPADAAGSHGFNAHAVMIDELHTQPSRDLYDVLRTSMAARRQPLLVSITTAGHDKYSICYEVWEYARQVRDGIVDDPHFLPVIHEALDKEDWTDREVWRRVNPNYGRSVSEEYLAEAFQRAQRTPAFENTFRNLHLNQWTESEARWIRSGDWDACAGDVSGLDGMPCYLALDLGSTDDITALAAVYPHDEHLYLRMWLFVPEETVRQASKRYQRQYQQWIREGWLTTTPGSATDYGFVRSVISEIRMSNEILMVGMDPWQALDTYNWLESEGIPALKVPQTFGGLWPGVKATEEAILNHTLIHEGSPVMRWMIDCTVVDMDGAGNRKPSKRKSQGDDGTKGKIDGPVAMVMAMGEMSQAEQAPMPQVF